jgi:isopentenyl diphosphate isomerase/L-lactate dehydrogenase-like FMN-dependent dehydrogenase
MSDRIEEPTVRATDIGIDDYERLAASQLDPGVHGYFAGGAGDERTLRENVASQAKTIYTLSTLATATADEVAQAAGPGRRWMQLYVCRDPGATRAIIAAAVDADFEALIVTVDSPLSGHRERDRRSGFAIPPQLTTPIVAATLGDHRMTPAELYDALVDPSLNWEAVEQLASDSLIPVLLKGICHSDDARRAADHGAAGIIVSNHGGRQLDTVPAGVDLLPACAQAVGDRLEVLLDGGVRRGVDVVKALALGARAVLVGRPVMWGLAVAGEAGVRRVLEIFRHEISIALSLLGCSSPAAVDRECLVRIGEPVLS